MSIAALVFPEFISVQMINLIIALNHAAIGSLRAACAPPCPQPRTPRAQSVFWGVLNFTESRSTARPPLPPFHSPSAPSFKFYCLKMNALKKYTPKLVTAPGFGFYSSKSPLQTKPEGKKPSN